MNLLRLCDVLDGFILRIGRIAYWLYAALLFAIVFNVVGRYFFHFNSIPLEEFQWHLYGAAMMLALSYTQVKDAHIRVDIFRIKYSPFFRHLLEVVAILVFLLPFVVIVFLHSLDFVVDSWRVNEGSDAPSGLPWRWAIKSIIPISFALLFISSLTKLLRKCSLVFSGEGPK